MMNNKVQGVSRMADNERALLISFSKPLTDDELRSFHNFARFWTGEDPGPGRVVPHHGSGPDDQ